MALKPIIDDNWEIGDPVYYLNERGEKVTKPGAAIEIKHQENPKDETFFFGVNDGLLHSDDIFNG